MAVLLVSELVANAVLHAHTPIRVVVRQNGPLVRVEVQDDDLRAPTRKHYSSLATTGRGLVLVERLARDWGVSTRPGGKSVWFELDSTAAPGAGDAMAFDLDADDLDLYEADEAPGPAKRASAERRGRPDLRLLMGGVR